MKSYFPLIEFNIEHDFFEENKCGDIDIYIARNETKLKNNFNFFLKKNKPWQYVLYIDKNENFNERAKLLEKDLKEDSHMLEFLLVARNRIFFSYTRDVDYMAGCRLVDLPVTINGDSNEPVIFNFKSVFKKCGDTSLNDFVARKYPSALACVTLHFSDNTENVISKRVENSLTQNVTFLFEAKSVFWQYILIPRVEKEMNLLVSESNQLVQFSDIEWAKFENNRKAGFSCSSNEIKLSEKYPYSIQLWEKYHNGQSLLVNRLSYPEPTNPANYSHDDKLRNLISIYQYF